MSQRTPSPLHAFHSKPEGTALRLDKSPTYLKISVPFRPYEFMSLLGGPLLKAFFVFIPVAFVSLYILSFPLHWAVGAAVFLYLIYLERALFSLLPFRFELAFQQGQISYKKQLFGMMILQYDDFSQSNSQVHFAPPNHLSIQTPQREVTFSFECNQAEAQWLNTEVMIFRDVQTETI